MTAEDSSTSAIHVVIGDTPNERYVRDGERFANRKSVNRDDDKHGFCRYVLKPLNLRLLG